MTPWQLHVCMDAQSDIIKSEDNKRIWLIWHQAAFQRCKTMPKLKDVLIGEKQPSPGIDERDIEMRMRAYQSRQADGN